MERNTNQRRAIKRVFEEMNRPLSPIEVLEAAQRQIPRLGIATVYRTLKSMVDQQMLVEVDLPGEATRYELSGLHHHHHFHCSGCGRAYDIEGCPGDLRGMLPPGFSLERHEIVLYGHCAGCQGKPAAKKLSGAKGASGSGGHQH